MDFQLSNAILQREKWKNEGLKVVFTNGVFDILHRGHVEYLEEARKTGDKLIVGVNSNSSVKRIKGEKRPIVDEFDRAIVISKLKSVDCVLIFNEDTPLEIITKLIPDILVKGEDWKIDSIVGKDVVEKNGGLVKTISFVPNRSSSNIIENILKQYNNK
ncbi:MAG: D-glycero-beta-D-manno-heptose 1-phosphate adenylyltransferase [Ignavibacteria bacterium]|nr:D-glycero-beta-D-manno-heptose 1-phosphate adenylyltransferase [Ignavibacteria bacterium]